MMDPMWVGCALLGSRKEEGDVGDCRDGSTNGSDEKGMVDGSFDGKNLLGERDGAVSYSQWL